MSDFFFHFFVLIEPPPMPMKNLTRPIIDYDPSERTVYRSFINHINTEADEQYDEDFNDNLEVELKVPTSNHKLLPNSSIGKEDDFMEKIYKCKEKIMGKIGEKGEVEFWWCEKFYL